MLNIFHTIECTLLYLPLICLSVIGLIPAGKIQLIRIISLIFSLLFLGIFSACWLFSTYNQIIYLNYKYIFNCSYEITNTSLIFLFLTAFLIFIVILISWQWLPKFYSLRTYYLLIFSIEFISFQFFTINNLLFFYIFFEAVLIPMYFLIGIWGLRPRKIHAAYQFFLYTFAGSLLMLISILYLYMYNPLCLEINNLKTEQYFLYLSEIYLIWFSFLLAFSIKVPLIPFHIWLPEAHVEAPTAGSVILAGLLLKYGTFGFYKILIINFFLGLEFFTPIIVVLSLISILYGSLITYIQIDFKKIIAYSSVSHMGYVVLGLTTNSIEGITGSLLMMITHGFISSGLFYIVGILYERYGTRNIFDYNGIKNIMPIFVLYFFLLTIANMNIPLTAGFISEFLVLLSLKSFNFSIIIFLACLGIITNGIYAIWLFNRVSFGKFLLLKNNKNFEYMDVTKRENFILLNFIFFIFFIGLFPNIFLNTFENDFFIL